MSLSWERCAKGQYCQRAYASILAFENSSFPYGTVVWFSQLIKNSQPISPQKKNVKGT